MGGEDTVSNTARESGHSDPPILFRIDPLLPEHSAAAARLHIAGQPGTFLSSLGPDVLSVVYSALPQSGSGFGFVAVPLASANAVAELAGFVSATTSVSRLFMETGMRRARSLTPVLLRRFLRRPALIGRSLQTGLYPLLTRESSREPDGASAELLSIMVERSLRRHGIGAGLLDALVAECQAREVTYLDVTVDADNRDALRFYTRHGFDRHRAFHLYGRQMYQYGRSV